MVILVLGFCLLSVTPGYAEQEIVAVPVIKATMGGSVELRCSMPMQDYRRICDPSSTYEAQSTHCYIKWTKDAVEYKNTTHDIVAKTTYDYCDNFRMTSSKFDSAMAPILPPKGNYNVDFRCYTSILTIPNLKDTDFDTYQCNYSYHYNSDKFNTAKRYAMATIMLVESSDPAVKPPPRMLMFHRMKSYDYYWYYFQCVTYGTDNLYWYITPCDGRHCPPEKTYEHAAAGVQDLWMTYRKVVSSDYRPMDNVVESFLLVYNLSSVDRFKVGCSYEKKPNLTATFEIYGPNGQDPSDSDYLYYVVYIIIVVSIISTLFVLLFLGFSIAACVRAKVCHRNSRLR